MNNENNATTSPSPSVWIFLALGLVAASQSGNIIRIGDAHPVAIAAWRLLLASLLLAPLAGRRLWELWTLGCREKALLVLAGVALALHFFAWITAVQWTSVANAAIFFAINPVLTATAAWLIYGERASWRLGIAIAVGLGGVVIIGVDDLDFSSAALAGDAMALLCSVLFTVYFLAGKGLRSKIDNRAYVTGIYGIAALLSFGVLLVMGLPLVDYSEQTWLCFVLMALVPTMIGHTSFNHALRYIKAGRISALTLSEPLMAAVVAYYSWGESMRPAAIFGYGLIVFSVFVQLSDGVGDKSGKNQTAGDEEA
ncbi:MAG: DMT family transporter [Deltaproteobacteria bacterium]|nr:DMT family transporter [Deltaproteobacteria bacterium]